MSSLEDEIKAASGFSNDEVPASLFVGASLNEELAAASGRSRDKSVSLDHGDVKSDSSICQKTQTSEQPLSQIPVDSGDQILKIDTPENMLLTAASEMPTDILNTLMTEGGGTLAERLARIQKALSAVTKYSHCSSCLQAKKSQAPDLVCLQCALSFCFRCSGRHKSAPSNKDHVMVPVAERQDADSQPRDPVCHVHDGAELTVFCQNCEVLTCHQCLAEEHQDCPGKVTLQEYAREEREAMKRSRVKYAQVMRFFSEQRRDTEETMAALTLKKQNSQSDIRKFFSALIKACMDVEGSMLEELETSATDHTDILTDQSSSWLTLQENTQQLLDIADILHFLPNTDFLPLAVASKACLSHALRDGESLAASCPPEMTLNLTLAQSSQRSIIKRIKEIGATALTITTHKTLTLRKVSTMSFSTADDKAEPLVTALQLLTHKLLVAADFNNCSLKLFQKEDRGEGWNLVEVLSLKWRPYGITILSKQDNSPSEASKSEDIPEQEDLSTSAISDVEKLLAKNAGIFAEKKTEMQIAGVEIQLVVSSPFSGCFIVDVSTSGSRKMKLVQAVDEEKGYWGLAAVTETLLAVSSMVSGRSYLSLIDTIKQSTCRLSLTSDTSLTPLVSPRHILAMSPSTVIVGDHGKKAVMHISTDGQILFTFTGNGSHRVSRPEGVCLDTQGHIYVADSGDHSIFVLTKGGHLYSRTGSQQNDLNCPQALCLDRNSCLYVSNEGGKLLTVYDMFQDS